MPHAFKASEIERRAQDGGDAARASRWFSNTTIKASGHYRDLSWPRLALHVTAAAALILISRIEPSWAIAPWMLIAGVVWAAWGVRAVLLKFLDRSRPQ